jgi:hypothetical protein
MKLQSEIAELRKAFVGWVEQFQVERFVAEDSDQDVSGLDEQFVWSVIWDWDENGGFVMPGYFESEESSGHYISKLPWQQSDRDMVVWSEVTLACEDCEGSGELESEDTCESCEGQGYVDDELVEVSSDVNYRSEPFL